ncbi:hypothetical protein [Aestuariivivens sediminis]|uniref:hypothetical protein n=1 Tax=Aestuariivivens sediminis TaxID=2913557 RepID=UPI001F59F30A|nr:hypothetical protein [Aestuariivivens sediminis]
MKKLNLLIGLMTLLLCISCSDDKVVFIDGEAVENPDDGNMDPGPGTAISPLLVGNNAWSYTRNITDQVWDLTADAGMQSIRIGGNGYNDDMPSNAILTDWVKRIQAMGAEPIMQVSQKDPASEAAALVKLFNVDLITGKPITYWNIGNEPWLEFNSTPTAVAGLVEPYFKERAAAMKEIDPGIKIYGPDFAYYIEPAIDDLFGGKNNIAGKVPGKDYYYCDGISWHRYPQSDSANQNLAYEGLDGFEDSIIKCKEKVDAVNEALGRTGANALGWGIGEFNAKNGSYVHNWGNGQMFGGILNLCMKYEATYATTWSMFENGGNRAGTDYSFIDGANMTPRATYRHMQMIAENFNGTYYEGKSSKSDIIVFGTVDNDKTSVMIMNRASSATAFNLTLNYSNSNTSGGVALNVNAGSPLSHSGDIEGLATHVYVFENGHVTRTSYTNSNFLNEEAPTVTAL